MKHGLRPTVRGLSGLLLSLLVLDGAADERPLDAWIATQTAIRSWSADVVQIRHLASLARPLRAEGRVWFLRPNRFRWQLGDPPRTIAVRNEDELRVAYPRLQRVERYAHGEADDPTLRQALALLELGLPSDAQHFHRRYELLSSKALDERWRFELAPRDSSPRELIERVALEVGREDGRLLATELAFADGARMRNEFSNHELNAQIAESLFELSLPEPAR